MPVETTKGCQAVSSSHWNDVAPKEATRGRDNPEDQVYERLMLRHLKDFVGPEDAILDIGGGPGRFSLAIAPLVKTVEHVDFAPKMIEIAAEAALRRGIGNITFSAADARDLSRYGDRSFTKALSINGPISFSGQDWRRSVAEMCRVADREALFTVANFLSGLAAVLDASLAAGAGWSAVVENLAVRRFMDADDLRQIGHNFPSYRAFAPGEVEEELDRHGFEVVSTRGLAILCRLLRKENLEAVVTDEALLALFLAAEETMAAMYGRWAPSREILFHVRRRG
jgi:ubiquinone/menaquinone biosynthesis C-methylase UbiE